MDADDRLIPIVEDDQGEGFKDIFEESTIEKVLRDRLKNLQKEYEKFKLEEIANANR